MLKKILLAAGIGLFGLMVIIFTRPSTTKVVRSVDTRAPADFVFAEVNNLQRWEEWSPWAKRDPAMTQEYGGAPAGKGATYHWAGNDEVGEGRMTIVESQAPQSIQIDLEFIKPFESTSRTTFTFEPSGEGTKVVWAMETNNNFMAKAFGLFVDVESMIGQDFDQGLSKLRVIAEKAATVAKEQAQRAAAAEAQRAEEAAAQAAAPETTP